MKHTYLFLSLLFICSACESEIPFHAKDYPSKLILNALFETEQDTNYVSLGMTGRDYASLIYDATVYIYVNDKLKDEITEATTVGHPIYERKAYRTTLKFSPGDRIRIEARTDDGEHCAWAEDIVPEAVKIEHIDTATYTEGSTWYSDFIYLRLNPTFTDRTDRKDFYRLAITQKVTYYGRSRYTDTDTAVVIEYSPNINIREDIALNDGRPPLDDSSYPFPVTDNRMCVFDDSRLNGSYTSNVSFLLQGDITYWGVLVKRLSQEVKVDLITISESEYYYLKALNLYSSDEYDEFLSQPITFPSNVHGGIGIFGIGTRMSQTVQMPDYFPTEEEQYWPDFDL